VSLRAPPGRVTSTSRGSLSRQGSAKESATSGLARRSWCWAHPHHPAAALAPGRSMVTPPIRSALPHSAACPPSPPMPRCRVTRGHIMLSPPRGPGLPAHSHIGCAPGQAESSQRRRAVRSQHRRAPCPTATSRPVMPHQVAGRHRASDRQQHASDEQLRRGRAQYRRYARQPRHARMPPAPRRTGILRGRVSVA